MQQITSIKALKAIVKLWHQQDETIALVPTMGNLHAGHIKLVKEAKKKADKVIVSIFVNPIQFCPGEDFANYPKTEVEDKKKLTAIAIDLLFLPTVDEIYYQQSTTTIVSALELSKLHCGASRPGHFDGVATIVTKLFNMTQPDIAVFGVKDFQQLLIIRNMVKDLNMAVKIMAVATEREADGLAMSSRNNYLTKDERIKAAKIYQSLCLAHKAVLAKKLSLRDIEQQQQTYLQTVGFKLDYFSICRQDNLHKAQESDTELIILLAAKLGTTRLIDNICFSR